MKAYGKKAKQRRMVNEINRELEDYIEMLDLNPEGHHEIRKRNLWRTDKAMKTKLELYTDKAAFIEDLLELEELPREHNPCPEQLTIK